MTYYHTPDISEYEQMKNTVKNHIGESIQYNDKIYELLYTNLRIIERTDTSIVYSGFCILKDSQENVIELSIKDVYDIISKPNYLKDFI